MKIEGVIFDMDGLLIDSEPLWKIAEIDVFKTVGIDLTETSCEETVGLRLDKVVELWHERHPWDNKTLKQVETEIEDRLIELVLASGKALPGVYDVLEKCKKQNLKTALASSSCMRIINAVVDKLEIRDCFQILHSAEFEEYGKPHPAVFLTAADKINVDPRKCLVFEDSFNGVVAALGARMQVVAVPEKSHQKDDRFVVAHQIIDSLEEFTF